MLDQDMPESEGSMARRSVASPPKSLADVGRGPKAPDKIAISTANETVSYRELDGRVENIRASLIKRGALPGDRIALFLPSSVAFVAYYLAAQRVGLVTMPLNPLLGATEVTGILTAMSPRMVILPPVPIESAAAKAAAAYVREAGGFCQGIRLENLSAIESDITAEGAAGRATFDVDREALILFTSGTSGVPKGASHRDGSVLRNALHSNKVLGITADDVLLSPLPLAHTFGQSVVMLGSLLAGAELAIPRSSSAPDVLRDMIERRATFIASVPTTFSALVEAGRAQPAMAREAGRRLRLALAGGSPLPEATARAFEELYETPLHQGYGMTEVACCIALEDASIRPTGTLGSIFPMLRSRILTIDGGDGVEGELQLSGPDMLRGYYIAGQFEERPADSWFPTGDLVRVGASGEISVFDRKKDMIIRNGYNVYPSEVEAALSDHPDVAICAVVGVDDVSVGQEVAAFVVLRPGSQASAAELANWCRSRIALYKYPRLMALLPALPTNASGKVLKRSLDSGALERVVLSE